VKKIKLVLSGSGTKFPVFAGALKRLEEAGCIVEEVIGTSGGSIIAAAIASGMSADKIIKLCKEIMPRLDKLVDFNVFRPLTDWGFVGGKKMKEELGKHFIQTLGEAKIPLHITATNFDTSALEIFSSKTHPKLETNRAVRASISIPVFFVPEIINGDMYVDGGVKANFAIDHFGNSPDVVGLYFVDKPGRKPRPKGMLAFANFIGRVIDMLISAKTEDDIEDAAHTNQIPLTSKVDGLDFSFKPEEVEAMIKEGYDGVDRWLKANPGRLK
jgi:NTE family protein